MKRITSLDVLGEVRRAKKILNRIQAYLEQQEQREKRVAARRAGGDMTAREFGSLVGNDLGEQG